MAKQKDWQYADANLAIVGDMVCEVCNKQVFEGDFRYRKTKKTFIIQHRCCSIEDQYWLERDRQTQNLQNYYRERLQAFEEFRDKWNVADLDEEIEWMRKFLSGFSNE